MIKKVVKRKDPVKTDKIDVSRRQEKVIKMLIQALELAGFSVRREELKRGFGWKVISGSCRLNNDKLVFVDRKMPLEEQVAFLTNSIHQRSVVIADDLLLNLSELGWKLEYAEAEADQKIPAQI